MKIDQRSSKRVNKLLLIALSFGLSACSSASWKEEALQPDGQKIVIDRSVDRKSRFELGQRPSIGSQSLTFTIPETGERVKWEDVYSEDVGGGNFNPLFAGAMKGTAYVLAAPAGCLSYNKWGRPNPPYVVFRYEGKKWKRIALQELPAEILNPNLIISSPDNEVRKSGKSYITVKMVERMNQGFSQPEYKTILREAMPKERCPKYSIGPNAPLQVTPITSPK